MKAVIYIILMVLGSQGLIHGQINEHLFFPIDKNFDHNAIDSISNDSLYGTWSNLSPLQRSLYGVSSIFLQDRNQIFICGGGDQDSLSSTCYIYDPSSDEYTPKAPLPKARIFGKLVRLKDSLFLIGSATSNFNTADGLIYKYDINANIWSVRDTLPQPFLQESAVCVYQDSVIIIIGGSTGSFGNPSKIVRSFIPSIDTIFNMRDSSFIPIGLIGSHAEILNDTSIIFLFGGVGLSFYNTIYKGVIDSFGILRWRYFGQTPYGIGVYRVGGGKWNHLLIFGPSLNVSTSYSDIYALDYESDTNYKWIKFLPQDPSNGSNRQSLAVDQSQDSLRLYAFGGLNYPNVLNSALKYTVGGIPIPIGISSISSKMPDAFRLYQNYPNPFNPVTQLSFYLPRSEHIKLTIFDMLGREVMKVIDKFYQQGNHKIEFNGESLSSGLYFYTLETKNFRVTKKMVILK